ncbi:MAG: class F sortase [Chloroflexota bacterium]
MAALVAVIPTTVFADPLTVSLPTLGIEAHTEPLSVLDGQLGAPVDPDTIGTYQLPGNLLLVGHVDWAGTTRAFAGLRSLHGGEPIELSDGRNYHVAWVSSVPTDQADLSDVFAPGDDVLTLITCGGSFSLSQHMYLERLTVRAVRDQR